MSTSSPYHHAEDYELPALSTAIATATGIMGGHRRSLSKGDGSAQGEGSRGGEGEGGVFGGDDDEQDLESGAIGSNKGNRISKGKERWNANPNPNTNANTRHRTPSGGSTTTGAHYHTTNDPNIHFRPRTLYLPTSDQVDDVLFRPSTRDHNHNRRSRSHGHGHGHGNAHGRSTSEAVELPDFSHLFGLGHDDPSRQDDDNYAKASRMKTRFKRRLFLLLEEPGSSTEAFAVHVMVTGCIVIG